MGGDGEVERPLVGVRVLDLTAGPFAAIARSFAEFGAKVTRVEAPQAEENSSELSRDAVAWTAANLSKSIERLDLAKVEGATRLGVLLEDAHLLICAPNPAGIDLVDLRKRRPELVIMTTSHFGSGNSYSGWQGTDAVLHALSGELSRSGIKGKTPLLPPGEISMQCAVAQGAYSAMLSLYHALATGQGDWLDFSALDGSVQALDPGYGVGGSATLGRPAKLLSRERPVKRDLYPIMPCADGDVRICLLAPRQWQGMFTWMGEPAEFAGEDYKKTMVRFQSTTLIPAITAFFADKTRSELEAQAQQYGVPLSAMLSLEECLAANHLKARGAFDDVVLPNGKVAPFPNGVAVVGGQRMGPHETSVADLVWPPVRPAGARPLEGLRVLDLGVIVVGAEQGRLLGDMGADVIKLETTAFPDGTRQSDLGIGLSVGFAAGHRNKRSLGLNLRDEEGKALFLKLAAKADVVLTNFKPGTMESLGLGYDVLRAVNPAIIVADSSAFGATGPWAKRMGYGPLVRAATGLSMKWRYPEDPDSYSDSITIYPDHVAARVGVMAVLAVMIRRLRNGEGGTVSVSQTEVMLSHFAAEIAETALGITEAGRPPDAPWGVYQAAGEDEWCVVTVRCDDDLHNLARVIERPDLAANPDYKTSGLRREKAADLDAAVAIWMADQDADAAMQALQRAGVPAAKMLRVGDLPEFGYFEERKLFRVEHHPHFADDVIAERMHIQSQILPDPPSVPAPLMGEHSAIVMREWLGLSDGEIDDLITRKILEPTHEKILAMIADGSGRKEH
ncbi:MAG: CoA transferase [Sphingorhabdus sp.]